MLAHADELRADDGVDPREYFKNPRARNKENRKAKQLCRQVSQALCFALADCEDSDDWEMLCNLDVVAVVPAPDSSRLLVQVCLLTPSVGDSAWDRTTILEALRGHAGRLRTEIAHAIHRKRVPTLVFDLMCEEGRPA